MGGNRTWRKKMSIIGHCDAKNLKSHFNWESDCPHQSFPHPFEALDQQHVMNSIPCPPPLCPIILFIKSWMRQSPCLANALPYIFHKANNVSMLPTVMYMRCTANNYEIVGFSGGYLMRKIWYVIKINEVNQSPLTHQNTDEMSFFVLPNNHKNIYMRSMNKVTLLYCVFISK